MNNPLCYNIQLKNRSKDVFINISFDHSIYKNELYKKVQEISNENKDDVYFLTYNCSNIAIPEACTFRNGKMVDCM